ncbi:uncharacterized protein [Miscanthus floridulus]|uniref:uncharacterized protein n=1 Tax=Miscanthus floridulus TaxID=154761 RepID=UPI0034592BE5
MEPLAEENEKLKEAKNLLEKNIQRAHRERDLAESNTWDLEYQKGVMTEKLAAASEQVRNQSEQLVVVSSQLKNASEQLNIVSKQKAEQDLELVQLRQAIEQLRQEKSKESERADKMAEELKGEYLLVGIAEAKVQKENFDVVVAAIKPVLDCVDLEMATQTNDMRQRSDTIIQRCKAAWENFKIFNRNAIMTVATHLDCILVKKSL